jgi:hypothetical protein
MKLRKLIRSLHRDIGYSIAALVIAYSISGLAVNHIEDWNPKYRFSEQKISIGPLPGGDAYAVVADQVVARTTISPKEVTGFRMKSEQVIQVFMKGGGEARVDRRTGKGVIKRQSLRPVLYEVNALHLNELKGIWTYVADLFAILLLVIAITGLLIPVGKNGIGGRGKYFLALGLSVPVAFIFLSLY